jgi:hypothetical protein
MVKQLFVRMVSAAGLLALALFFVGVDPFLSVGAGLTSPSPAISIDRSLKGDRLPISAAAFWPDWQSEFGSWPSLPPRAQMPFACDAAVSTILAPLADNVYRRCMT